MNLDDLLNHFAQCGVRELLCKSLAENDNRKQQIYLGGSLDVLQMLPFQAVQSFPDGARPNFKAGLSFYWLSADGRRQKAPGAQLILYPQYPEVRLSGFLRGCPSAPRHLLQCIPAEERRFNNGPDGRLLLLGANPEGQIFAFLAPAGSMLADAIRHHMQAQGCRTQGVFTIIPISRNDGRAELLAKLREIHLAGWHEGMRLDATGQKMPFKARNAGGYTLEALLGVIPNGRAEPDFMGWELKTHGSSRITLMTPEPDAGYYGNLGVREFVLRFGHDTSPGTRYFTGQHKVGIRHPDTGLTLVLDGYDAAKRKITDVNGALHLMTDKGEAAASWTFTKLLTKWNLKHAHAAFVSCESDKGDHPQYRYGSPVLMGEGTEFIRFLAALQAGDAVYDPGSKVTGIGTPESRVKARSQFRTSTQKLAGLYERLERIDL